MNKIIIVFIFLMSSFSSYANDYLSAGVELIKDDYKAYDTGGKSFINYGLEHTNASKLIAAFDDNQVKYNRDYVGNYVQIITIASAIKSYPNGNAYIIANGKNNYEYIVMDVDKNSNEILNLKRGDRINMVCIGRERARNYPEMRDCIFTDEFARKRLEVYLDYLNTYDLNKKFNYQIDVAVKTAMDIAKEKNVCRDLCSQEEFKALVKDSKDLFTEKFKLNESKLGDDQFNSLPDFPLPPKPQGSSKLATMYK